MVALASLLTGAVAALITQSWLDVVGGDWLVNAGVLSLTVFAIGATLPPASYALRGEGGPRRRRAPDPVLLVGNPFSAVRTRRPRCCPSRWAPSASSMPPGAGANLLRSTGFFDGAGGGTHLAVLAAWALAGLACPAVAAARGTRLGTAPAGSPA